MQLSTSVFGMESLSRNRNATENRKRSQLDRRLQCIRTKLDEGNVMIGIRTTVGDNKIADFTVVNYAALKLKYSQRETLFRTPHVSIVSNLRVLRPQSSHVLPQRL